VQPAARGVRRFHPGEGESQDRCRSGGIIPERHPTDLPERRVLVIDDSKFVRKTFTSILSASFAVREEADGEAGWEAIDTDPSIVMVFTDLDMPKLAGCELLGRIRGSRDPRLRALPVGTSAGNGTVANEQRAASAWVDGSLA